MPDITAVDLSKYRLERSREMLATAKRDADAKDYASANNRAYYCIFHAMRSVLALDGEDYKKHSAVISRFSALYLKTEQLPKEYSKLISNGSLIRNKSDYEDFYLCSMEDTKRLISGAEDFLNCVSSYLHHRYERLSDECKEV